MQHSTKTIKNETICGQTIIGSRVKQGMIQRVSVKFDAKGNSTITPVSDWTLIKRKETL